jgi:transcriptional regulator with XRE-family HTH domain
MGMDKKTLGSKIRRLREEQALNQSELAAMAGITTVHLGRIERGESYPRPRTRRGLAGALGVEPKDLLKEDG